MESGDGSLWWLFFFLSLGIRVLMMSMSLPGGRFAGMGTGCKEGFSWHCVLGMLEIHTTGGQSSILTGFAALSIPASWRHLKF